MIEALVAMRCDGCNLVVGAEDPDGFGGVAFPSAEKAWDAAVDEGWSTNGHKHYCPACWDEKRKTAAEATRAVGWGDRS